MVMDVMRINQGYVNQCPIIDEKLNANMTWFFEVLKDPTNHYGMSAQIIVNYQLLHKCSPSSQIMG